MSWSSGTVGVTTSEGDARYAQLGAANVFTNGTQDFGATAARGIKFGTEGRMYSSNSNVLAFRNDADSAYAALQLSQVRAGTNVIGGSTSSIPAGHQHMMQAVTNTNVALLVKGAASQSGDLQQYQDSAAAVLASISATGIVKAADGTAVAPGITFQADPDNGWYRSGTNTVSMVTAGQIREVTSLGIRNMRDDTVLSWFAVGGSGAVDTSLSRAAAGQILADLFKWKAANEQATVGAAGAAAALPATPTTYLKVVDSAGTTLIIPAYAAA